MRYTRYNLKPKSKFPLLISVFTIMALGILFGFGIYKLVIGLNILNTDKNTEEKQDNYLEVVIVQSGVYSTKENADEQVKVFGSESLAFVVEEDDKYKVMVGIFDNNNLTGINEKMKKEKISCYNIKYSIGNNSDKEKVVYKIVDGYMKIIYKFSEDSNVKAINTEKYKEWCKGVFNEYSGEDTEISDIKELVDKIPEECDRENAKVTCASLYGLLKEYRKN